MCSIPGKAIEQHFRVVVLLFQYFYKTQEWNFLER